MAIDDILRALDEECEQTIAEIKEKAVEQAKQIIAEAEQKAEAARVEAVEKEKEKIASEAAEIVNMARLQAKKIQSEAAEKAVEKVFEDFEKWLLGLKGDERKLLLRKILENVIDSYKFPGSVVIKARKEDVKIVEDLLREAAKDAEVIPSNNFKGGIIVSDPEEKTILNGSYEVLIEKARKELRSEVFSELFGS